MSNPVGLVLVSVKNSGVFVTFHDRPRSSGKIAFDIFSPALKDFYIIYGSYLVLNFAVNIAKGVYIMRKILLLCLAALLLSQGVCLAKEDNINGTTKEVLSSINSLYDIPEPISIIPGLTVSMDKFFTQFTPYKSDPESAYNYYFYKSKSWYGGVTYYFKEVVGFKLTFVNNSANFYTIQWSASNMTFGNFSGIPFLGGMKYIDAGKPDVTPNTLLPPNTTTTITLYTSDVEFDSGNWIFSGELVPSDNTMQPIFHLKVISDNLANYYTVKFSHIGIKKK